MVGCVPRLIQDELSHGLRQHHSSLAEQIASRLDVRAKTPLNNVSVAMSPAGHVVSAPITAHQLLHSGHVNSAFEMVHSALSAHFHLQRIHHEPYDS